MSLVKIEFDLPEFKNNLEISLTLKRDGETVVCETTSTKSDNKVMDSPLNSNQNKIENKDQEKLISSPSTVAFGGVSVTTNTAKKVKSEPTVPPTGGSKFGGNCMNVDF